MRWEVLVADLPPTIESLGLAQDDGASNERRPDRHGRLRRDEGCVLLLENTALARRTAFALAIRLKVPVCLYEGVGSRASKRLPA